MNILLTGVAGFIGSNLLDELLQNKDHTVIGIDNLNDFYDPLIKQNNIKNNINNKNFIFYNIDLLNTLELKKIFENNKIDNVIHLAGYGGVRPSIENPKLYIDNNIVATLNILECMKNHKIQKLVYASSSSVYGNSKENIFKETLNVSEPISPYAMTKKACEELCYTYHKLYNIKVIALRFFTVYGKRQRPDLAISKFTKLILENNPIPVFGDGSTMRDYTYIEDIVSGIISAIEYNKTNYEIINLGGGEPINLERMIKTIETVLGKKAIINRMEMQKGDVDKTVADITKARNLLNYNPSTSFENGIKKFVDWYIKK
ncbi:epimerase [Brachyspira hyodysenteriae]|uniref:Epimerase n=1 Tax=Brachyspira hyodysenteriae ATCC 27164 TaxID=1266923 RepID=A0A3B6VUZ7_BRAHO|nr:GDP-mannose 4,6-dehydratase [Brachyspira hyodysenteriae]ANN64894.1 epimerase [Brachyspira hyodysenteriae ATCC 27164]KLI28088.1 epimerase [Brachyspira hyodysenteriae]MCZ9926290.1 GDP-mannose 4,6-dehydratase [Brachyspira hyodysenteriae]TVL62491.1 epimerase [Brachyspira hyodysenteriae]TVL76086.1 epimerase [Brachyspira hyodysenteriae]